MTSTTRLKSGFLIALTVFVAVSCSPVERPDAADWLSRWEGIQAVVPPQSELGSPPDGAVCEETLAALRAENDDLRPTPSDEVEEHVDQWVEVAETTFFECPPEGDEISSFAEAYAEMARIAASVDEALSLN